MEEENQMGEAAALGRLRQEGEMRAPPSDGSDDESVGGASERQRA